MPSFFQTALDTWLNRGTMRMVCWLLFFVPFALYFLIGLGQLLDRPPGLDVGVITVARCAWGACSQRRIEPHRLEEERDSSSGAEIHRRSHPDDHLPARSALCRANERDRPQLLQTRQPGSMGPGVFLLGRCDFVLRRYQSVHHRPCGPGVCNDGHRNDGFGICEEQ